MTEDEVIQALEPAIRLKNETFAANRPIIPILLARVNDRCIVYGLEADKGEWPRIFRIMGEELHPTAVVLVVDAWCSLTPPTGPLSEDPAATEAMVAIGVDAMGVLEVAAPYAVNDHGKLEWREMFATETVGGEMVNALRLAVLK